MSGSCVSSIGSSGVDDGDRGSGSGGHGSGASDGAGRVAECRHGSAGGSGSGSGSKALTLATAKATTTTAAATTTCATAATTGQSSHRRRGRRSAPTKGGASQSDHRSCGGADDGSAYTATPGKTLTRANVGTSVSASVATARDYRATTTERSAAAKERSKCMPAAVVTSAACVQARRERYTQQRRGTREKGVTTRDAKQALANYVRSLEPHELLEHSEEIKLTRQVQRLRELEKIYAGLVEERQRSQERRQQEREHKAFDEEKVLNTGLMNVDLPAESTNEAMLSGGGNLREEWAEAANVSMVELRTQLMEGQRARERIVISNLGLVGSLVQRLKRASGGQLDLGITEADLVQEVSMW